MKKIVFADYIATNLVRQSIFANPASHSGMESYWGYTAIACRYLLTLADIIAIAIGVALLMGFRLPINW